MIRGLLLVVVGLASIFWTMPAQAALNHAAPDFPGDRVIELCADPGRKRDSVGSGDDALFKACSTARTKRLDIEWDRNVAVIGGAYATAAAGTVPPGQPPTPPVPAAPAASVLTDLSNHPLFAATPALGLDVLNGIVETFKNQAKLWENTLSGLATSLFVTLAIIELVWVIGWATARRTGLDDMLAIAAEQIVIIGFFYWLMVNTADFVLAIIDSFAEAANQASIAGGGSKNLGPSDIFAAGLNMTKTIWNGMTVFDIPFSMLLCLAGIINIIVFAKITAKLIEVLIESSFAAYMPGSS
jgi:hypothetical protein